MDLDTERRMHNSLNLFWLGFTIYAISYPMVYGITEALRPFVFLQLLGLMAFLYGAINLIRFRIENRYLRVMFLLYCSWLMIVILRGVETDREFIIAMMFNAHHGIFLYFVPFIILIPKDITYLRKVFHVITILGIFFIVYLIYAYKNALFLNRGGGSLIEYISSMSIPIGFILVTYIYHTGRRIILAIGIIILMFLEAMIRARRGLIFMSLSILLLTYLVYYFVNRGRLVLFLLSLIVAAFVVFMGMRLFEQNRSDMFKLIANRWNEDTRSEVTDYFYRDMERKDWVFGKGLNGEYFCPGIENNQRTSQRSVIETGYLQIILKGGIISLLLFLLIAVPAMIKGIFMSRNILSKAAGIWIFLALISLFPRTVNTFSLNYMLVWISIGICYSLEIRYMSDEAIKEIIKPDRFKAVKPTVEF